MRRYKMAHYWEIADIVYNILSSERVRLTLHAYMDNSNRDEIIGIIKNFVISFKETEGRFPKPNDFVEECQAFAHLYS
jgi:hypothetical protein